MQQGKGLAGQLGKARGRVGMRYKGVRASTRHLHALTVLSSVLYICTSSSLAWFSNFSVYHSHLGGVEKHRLLGLLLEFLIV